MDIAKFAVNRRVTVLMLVLMVVLIGAVSYSRLPVDLFPKINFPGAAVVTDFPGAAPEEVEALVTRPLEGALGTLANVERVQSVSSEGRSVIILYFRWDTDMDFAALDMREKVDMVKRYLPGDIGTPSVIKFDPSMLPIMEVGMGSDQMELGALRDLAESVIVPRLERIPGVASVSVRGGSVQEYRVAVDQSRLEKYGIPLSQATSALRAASLNLSGGYIVDGGAEYLVRVLGKIERAEDLGSVVIGVQTKVETVPAPAASPAPALPPGFTPGAGGLPEGTSSLPTTRVTTIPVYLTDVAAISLVFREQTSLSRLNRQPNVSLTLQKQSDANTVAVANLVKAELDQLINEYPAISLLPTLDQSRIITKSLDIVATSALMGAGLAVAILLVFLRDLRSTIIIGLSVPVSVIATFILLFFSRLTINLMTLSGLALGIGMLVDNSIVVLENMFRHLEMGEDRKKAARRGAAEVAMAITASTLTTVAVFLPVVFVGGLTGTLFRELALTVSFSLFTSLAVALTVVPMLGATLLKETGRRSGGILPELYARALGWAVRHKLLVVGLTVVLFIGSLTTLPRIGGEFLPRIDSGELDITAVLPSGAKLEETAGVASYIEDKLLSYDEVSVVAATIGTGGGRFGLSTRGANEACFHIILVPADQRKLGTARLARELREAFADYAAAEVTVTESQTLTGGGAGGMGGPSVQLEITGPDLVQLGLVADRIAEDMVGLGYFSEIENSIGQRLPEVQVRVDLEKAGQLGLVPAVIGSAVRTAFRGETVGRIMEDGRELEIIVSLRPEDRANLADLENLMVAAPGGKVIRLGEVAEIITAQGPMVINRLNNQRLVTLSAELTGKDLRQAEADLNRIIDDLDLPEAYQVRFGGELKEMREAFSSLGLTLLLAVALVYMVMASQFESLIHPFTVMFTMPLALIGGLLLLFFTGQKFNVPSVIGFIMLAGIVVNNAIVLVDFINQLRARGTRTGEAVIEAGRKRLRPILMTALTTVLALVPMALRPGAGSELAQPMAVAVIGGLTTATFLTLFIIPIVYLVFDRLFPRATNVVARDEPAEGD